jgi:hypothetical protein
VNAILTRVLDPIEDEVAARYDPLVGRFDEGLLLGDEAGALEVLKSWREGAWRNAERLAAARDDAEREVVMASIERAADAWATAISAGRVPGHSATRDAHCLAR